MTELEELGVNGVVVKNQLMELVTNAVLCIVSREHNWHHLDIDLNKTKIYLEKIPDDDRDGLYRDTLFGRIVYGILEALPESIRTTDE